MSNTTNWQAEAERLRALLDVSEQARQSALRALADATERGIDGHAEAERLRASLQFERDRSERYLAERNAARLEAQREVGETVRKLRKLREEREQALAELERVQARGWPSTPEDVRALLGSSCGAVRYALPVPDGAFEAPPHEDDTYTVSAHDLITCNIAASEMRYAADFELERVRARLAEIERQEPVAWIERITGRLATPTDEHRTRFPMVYSPLIDRPVPHQHVSRADELAPPAASELDADIIAALRAVVQQLTGRAECKWPGRCAHKSDAPERAEPADGCGACGDACRSRGSCRLADESPEPAAKPCRCGPDG